MAYATLTAPAQRASAPTLPPLSPLLRLPLLRVAVHATC